MIKPLTLLLAVLFLSACKPEATPEQDAATPPQTQEQPPAPVTPPVTPVEAVPLPPDMMFNGHPIDPLCFQLPLSEEQAVPGRPIALDECENGEGIIRPATIDWRPDAGAWIGYEYGYPLEGEAEPVKGAFSKYRYLGKLNGQHLILSAQSGGGSGVFTAVSGFARTGNTLTRVRDYALGDRCNSGIADAAVRDGRLVYEVNLTPVDILALAGLEKQFVPYEDLESSASSCYATALYTDGEFMGIRLDRAAFTRQPGLTGRYKYQDCFNAVGKNVIDSGQVVLGRRTLYRLSETFQSSCLPGR